MTIVVDIYALTYLIMNEKWKTVSVKIFFREQTITLTHTLAVYYDGRYLVG